jgi:hypothetical protein
MISQSHDVDERSWTWVMMPHRRPNDNATHCHCDSTGKNHQHQRHSYTNAMRYRSRQILPRRHHFQRTCFSLILSSTVLFLSFLIILPVLLQTNTSVDAIPLDLQPVNLDDVDGIDPTVIRDRTHVKSSLRGDTTAVTASSDPTNNRRTDIDVDYKNDDDDDERYILDYDQIDVQHSQKLVTRFDHPSPQTQRQQKQLFSSFRRNITNITWIVRVDSDQTTNLLLSKIVPDKIVYRMNLVFNGFIVKGISRSTLTWLLRRTDVLLVEEVRM